MNMQAILKQAQSLQKEMTKAKDEIDKTIFDAENGCIKISINGKKEMVSVMIDKSLEMDDIEMLEDMILLAYNLAAKKVDDEIESKLGRYSKTSIPGLF